MFVCYQLKYFFFVLEKGLHSIISEFDHFAKIPSFFFICDCCQKLCDKAFMVQKNVREVRKT